MRDIRADLRDRAQRVAQQISAENIRFESMLSQLKVEQDRNLKHLRAQLHLAKKLLEFTVWQDNVRAHLATRIAKTEEVESLIKTAFDTATTS